MNKRTNYLVFHLEKIPVNFTVGNNINHEVPISKNEDK